jgi:hypothetical protein
VRDYCQRPGEVEGASQSRGRENHTALIQFEAPDLVAFSDVLAEFCRGHGQRNAAAIFHNHIAPALISKRVSNRGQAIKNRWFLSPRPRTASRQDQDVP